MKLYYFYTLKHRGMAMVKLRCIINRKWSIDLFFTNKALSFQGISTTETGLSNCHKLRSTFVRSFVSLLKQKKNVFLKL